jgi:hypothetical protein
LDETLGAPDALDRKRLALSGSELRVLGRPVRTLVTVDQIKWHSD